MDERCCKKGEGLGAASKRKPIRLPLHRAQEIIREAHAQSATPSVSAPATKQAGMAAARHEINRIVEDASVRSSLKSSTQRSPCAPGGSSRL